MARQDANATIDLSVATDQWTPFLAEFTLDNRGAHATLEVLEDEVGHQIETENRPFDGIAADLKDGERNIWIHFGSTPSDHLAHGIHKVTALRIKPSGVGTGPAVEIDAGDGSRTILELTDPLAYALPPAD